MPRAQCRHGLPRPLRRDHQNLWFQIETTRPPELLSHPSTPPHPYLPCICCLLPSTLFMHDPYTEQYLMVNAANLDWTFPLQFYFFIPVASQPSHTSKLKPPDPPELLSHPFNSLVLSSSDAYSCSLAPTPLPVLVPVYTPVPAIHKVKIDLLACSAWCTQCNPTTITAQCLCSPYCPVCRSWVVPVFFLLGPRCPRCAPCHPPPWSHLTPPCTIITASISLVY